MAIIYSYPEKSSPAGGDFLVITDSEQPAPKKNRTKSLTIDNLASYVITSQNAITGGGTLNTIAMFTPDGQKIGNSFMTYNPTNQFFVISKRLKIDGDLQVDGRGNFTGDYLGVNCPLRDGSGLYGTAGQVLSSTGTGVEWISGGSVTGTGITNTLPIWSDGPSGVLGNSGITQTLNANNKITNITLATNGADPNSLSASFGTGGSCRFSVGDAGEFMRLTPEVDGFYKSRFRFQNKVTVDRNFSSVGPSLDVGDSDHTYAAAWFRNGVVISNNPSGVQVDNTSMVIGGGNNDVVSGSDNCLAVGNNNQILSDSDNSLAVGQGNIIRNNSDNCFAVGLNNIIDGSNIGTNSVRSQVLGFDNSLSDSYSSFIAGGNNTVTTGNNAFALGYSHNLQGVDSQFAFGENCNGPASGQNTFMMGSALTGSDKSMAVGFRNDTSSYPAIDYPNGLGETKFVVGVGSNSTSNAIIITEGGVNRGNPNIEQIPRVILPTVTGFEYANGTLAKAAGIPVGGLFHTAGVLKIVLSTD